MSAKKYLSNSDPVLCKIIKSIPEPKIVSTENVFQDLMSCVVEQQIHYRSSKKVFHKMMVKARLTVLNPDNFSQFEEQGLGESKLSIKKYETITDIVDFWKENQLDWHKMHEGEVIDNLSKIKGIGNWTIDMILMYTLGEPNIFPAEDYHLKQIMIELYGLDPKSNLKKQMLEVAEGYGDYRSLAVKYLLGWKNHQKRLAKSNIA